MSENLMDQDFFSQHHSDQVLNCTVNMPRSILQCLICSKQLAQEEAVDIFCQANDILEKIHLHLFIFVQPNDSLPKHICISCFNQLECYSDFLQKIVPSKDQPVSDLFKNFNSMQETLKEERNLDIKDEPIYTLLEPLKQKRSVNQLSRITLDVTSSNPHSPSLVIEKKDLSDIEDNSSSGDTVMLENLSKCPVVCDHCNGIFVSEEQRNQHNCIPLCDSFICHICDTKFNRALMFRRHTQVCGHNFLLPNQDRTAQFNVKSQDIGIYNCDVCNANFSRSSLLVKHRLKHKPKSEWTEKCNLCDTRFERHALLVRHLKTVHADNKSDSSPWKCRHCGKHMMTKLSLGIHERIHTGAKPYVCEWCGQRFRSRANLLQHHPKHTGIKKHKCEECGKLFSRKSFVTAHMRVHTGERPYSCRVCNRKFTQIGDMRRHEKKHEISIKHGRTCYTVIDLSKSPSPESINSADSDDKLTDSEIAIKVKVIQE